MKSKILLINDDEDTRKLILLILQQSGYETLEASSGQEGIDQTLKSNPNLILLDIMMPEMDGYEVCRRLKTNPQTEEIPIIFMTALDSPRDTIKGLELGGVDFIHSNIDHGELLARVQTQLKIRGLAQQLKDYYHDLVKKQRILNADLKAASLIQNSLLPNPNFQFPGIDITWGYFPCNPIGGDFLNVNPIDNETLVFYVLDVSGHDVSSAMVTVSVYQYLQNLKTSKVSISPREILKALNKEYPFERFERYFTIFYAVYNIKTRKLKYSSAGHPPGILLKPFQPLEVLDVGGTIIGVTQESVFEEGEKVLTEGDKLILYTDGLTEIENIDGNLYGTEKLYALIENNKKEPVDLLKNIILNEIQKFGEKVVQNDDITIMCLEFGANSGVKDGIRNPQS